MSHKPQILRDYRLFSPTNQVTFGDQVIGEMTTHAVSFPTPKIAMLAFTLVNDTLRGLNTAAASGDAAAIQARDNYVPTWVDTFDQQGDYINLTANGNTTILEESGYHFTGEFNSQVVPGLLTVKARGNAGHGSVHFESNAAGHGAGYLMIGVKNANLPGNIDVTVHGNLVKLVINGVEIYIQPGTRRNGDIDGLIPRGSEINIVMAAFNSAGMGPLSEPASVTIP